MKTFGLKNRFSSLIETIESYPMVAIGLGILCIVFNVLIWNGSSMSEEVLSTLGKIVMMTILSLFLLATVTKTLQGGTNKRGLWQGIVLVGIGIYYVMFPGFLNDVGVARIIQHGLVQFCGVLALLVVPLAFVERGNHSIYESIVHLLLHAALAVLFAILLASGISLALLGIQRLFEVIIVGERYGSIYATIGIIFGGLSFLDGVRTRDVADSTLGKSLKWKSLLGRVVGVLLLVYAVILYAYLAKIIITGVWPSGQVTLWSFVFSALVVLGSILLVPLIESDSLKDFRARCLNWLYGLLLPVAGMVACAIYLRIDQYGLTEARYLVVAILLWLAISSMYMLVSKKKDLWIVSALLLIFGIVAGLGSPISARTMSFKSQMNALNTITETNDLMTASGMLDKEKMLLLDKKTRKTIAGKIAYLIDHHDVEFLPEKKGQGSYSQLQALGLENARWGNDADTTTRYYYDVSYNDKSPVSIAGYTSYYTSIPTDMYTTNGTAVSVNLETGTLSFEIDELLEKFKERNDYQRIPRNEFVIEIEGAVVFLQYLNVVEEETGQKRINSIGFDLAVK